MTCARLSRSFTLGGMAGHWSTATAATARYDGRFATRTAAQQAGATSHVEFCPQLVGIRAVAGEAPSLQEWQDAVRKQEVGSRWWCRAGATGEMLTSHKTGTTCFIACFIGENFEKITSAAGGLKSRVLAFPVPWIPDKAFRKLCWAKCSMFFPLRFLRFVPGRAVFTHRQLPDMKIRSGLAQNTLATIAICLSWQTAGRCGW